MISAGFSEQVLGQLQPHHQFPDLGAGQGQFAFPGSARDFSPRAPVSKNTRFQLSSSWAGTWLSRETASRGLPSEQA